MSRVVLIADATEGDHQPNDGASALERPEPRYVAALRESLKQAGLEFVEYHDPRSFADQIVRHTDDVVLSIWAGQKSRNRKALIPALCETSGIAYVGADAYAQILCADKAASAHLAQRLGWSIPRSIVIDTRSAVPLVESLDPPVVAKPMREGGSIGISARSFCTSHSEARDLAVQLLDAHRQPVIIEEYIDGPEVSIALLGVGGSVNAAGGATLSVNGTTRLPMGFLYDSFVKKGRSTESAWLPTPEVLTDRLLGLCESVFRSLSKVELLRIDGRLSGGTFVLLELTPDIHLGPQAAFAMGMQAAGHTHSEWLEMAVRNARDAFLSGSARTR